MQQINLLTCTVQAEKLVDRNLRGRVKANPTILSVFKCEDYVVDGWIALDIITKRVDAHLCPPEPLRIRHKIKCAASSSLCLVVIVIFLVVTERS